MLVYTSAFLLTSGTVAFALSQAGSSQDPLVSLNYLENTYSNELLKNIASNTQEEFEKIDKELLSQIEQIQNSYSGEQLEKKLVDATASALGYNQNNNSTNIVMSSSNSFSNGTQLKLAKTTEICITSGSAQLSSGTLINLSSGENISVGSSLVRNQLYISPTAGNSIKLTSPVKINITGNYTKISDGKPQYNAKYTAYADALNDLGLFSGSTSGYNLERASTRAEGLVMLIRMLGEEERAKNYKGTHPFKDVPEWADRYVAYGYEKGYTTGINSTTFGSQNTLSLNDYMTFLLRALEYNDKKGDFTWQTSGQYAINAGIISKNELDEIAKRGTLYRDDIVYTSYNALFANCKNENLRLCDKLLKTGVFTKTQLSLVQKSLSSSN